MAFFSHHPRERERPRGLGRWWSRQGQLSKDGWPWTWSLKWTNEVRTFHFFTTTKGVAEQHPSRFFRRDLPPSPSGSKPEVDGYALSVCRDAGGSFTPLSKSSGQHTKRGPCKGWSEHFLRGVADVAAHNQHIVNCSNWKNDGVRHVQALSRFLTRGVVKEGCRCDTFHFTQRPITPDAYMRSLNV